MVKDSKLLKVANGLKVAVKTRVQTYAVQYYSLIFLTEIVPF